MPRDTFSFDTKLAFGSSGAAFNLAKSADTGLLMWEESVVPAFVQQQNQGALTKSALPADLSVLVTYEDWSGGAGRVNASPGDAAPNHYSFSRGIDASWGNVLYLSPQKQTVSGITGTVLKFYTSTFGEFAITARRVYEFSGGSWVERYDAGSDIITDITDYGNSVDEYLVVARGDSNDIVYSLDGVTFGGTSAGNRYTYIRVRGHTALNPILVGVGARGAVATATAIGTFTANDQAGSTTDAVNGIEVWNDFIVIFKDDGLYTFDGTDVVEVVSANALYRPTNGAAHTIWGGDRNVYFNLDNRGIKFDGEIETVYFPEHPELNGEITALAGTTTHLYFAITNSAGGVYIMKGNPAVGAWHTLAYLGANPVSALHVFRQGNVHATNDVLMFDGAGTTGYFILAQDGLRPEDDTAYRFDTATGYIYGPLTDGGVLAMTKRLNGVRGIAESATAANLSVIKYGLDEVDTTPTTALTLNEDGLAEARMTTETPFTRLHYYVTMEGSDSSTSPRVLSVVFDVTPYPQRRRRFTFTVKLSWRPGPAAGINRRGSFTRLRRFLFQSLDQQVTLTDPWQGTFIGKVQDVAGAGYEVDAEAGQGASVVHALYRVVFEEITETTSDGDVAVWNQSEWDDSSVYDD